MRRELEIIGEREISVNVRHVSRNFWARFRILTGTGVSLGFVLFVALTTVTLKNRSSNFVGAAWKRNLERRLNEPSRNFVIPRTPNYSPVRVFRPTVVVRRPTEDYRMVQEKRLLWNDLWGHFNQTLNTARSFSK